MQGKIVTSSAQGHFQWNAAAWFGSAFGASAWMAVASTLLAVYGALRVALVPAACTTAVLVLAAVLWRRRDRLAPFPAILILLAAVALANPIAWIAVSRFGPPEALGRMNWPAHGGWDLVVLLIAPLVMVGFCFTEWQARTR